MTRTRGIFIAIVGVTAVFICVMVGWQIIGKVTDGNGLAGMGDGAEMATAVPEGTILIPIASSSTKRNWMDQVVEQFNAAGMTTNSGAAIVAEVTHVTSGGSMNDILDGTIQPVVWSPGDQSWVAQANDAWKLRANKPIASEACQPTVYAPLGFAMWRPMAEALGWPDTPIGWDTIVKLAADPEGWGSVGRPEWGQFSFGHTHPAYANSGLLSMTGFVYGVADTSEGLSAADIYSDDVQAAMASLENITSKYGKSSPALLDLMAREGTGFLHAAAVPEADTVKFNIERGDELTFPLAFIFPAGGTIWADHPYCILDNAEWVTDEQAEAAAIFRDYLLADEQQSAAIDNYLRPLDPSIPLHAPLSMENGTDASINTDTIPALPSPSSEVSTAVIDIFNINKRKATILVVMDVSGSMEGDRIKTARTATSEFLQRLDANDEVGVMIFSDAPTMIEPPARVGDIGEGLGQRVDGLLADGNTALYESVCLATDAMQKLQQKDADAGESRLYGIILLSDGEDTVGNVTENQMFSTCLPSHAEANGIKIFPIAFGEGADQTVLDHIANVTGGRMFTADPSSISNIYIAISAEQ